MNEENKEIKKDITTRTEALIQYYQENSKTLNALIKLDKINKQVK